MKFDLIVFGSAFYDTYITSDEFKVKHTQEGMMLCELYGKKIEIKDVVVTTGGGATNAAVCFERMGLQSALVSCLGRDSWGRMVKEQLEQEGVSLLYLQTDKKYKTSSSIALVGNDGDRTILVHRGASNHISWHNVDWNRLDGCWAYISSLGGDFSLLDKILFWANDKKIKLAFNPGGGELKEVNKLNKTLSNLEILLLNKQEAIQLTGDKELKKTWFYECGAQITVVTDGKNGADVFTADKKYYHQDAIKTEAVEVTGAGDGFGSGFVSGIVNELSIEQALKLAAYNSASVVEHIGPKAGILFWPEAKKLLKF